MENNSTYSVYHPRGFYYDTQLSNPLMTATLHPNTYISNLTENLRDPYELNTAFEWKLYDPKETPCLDPITHNYSKTYRENPSACYRKKPLITAILTEDFQVNAGNVWGDHNGGQEIENMVNGMKSFAPYYHEAAGGFGELKNKFENLAQNSMPWVSKGSEWAAKQAGRLEGWMSKYSDKLNGALVIQGTRFSYYGGTSTTFGNLSMRFTLFADWILDENGNPEFKTVHDQLLDIYPYAIGKYDPISFPSDRAKGDGSNQTRNEVVDAVGDFFETFFGWQSPPAGFKSDIRSIDTCQMGTLRLVLGGYYSAENLVIDGMNVNFSKTMTKIPTNKSITRKEYRYKYDTLNYDKDGNQLDNKFSGYEEKEISTKGGLTPLYADVTITLKPASNYTDNTIINFSSNNGRGYISKEIAKLRNAALTKEGYKKIKDRNRDTAQYRYKESNVARPEIEPTSVSLDLPDKLPERMVKVQQPNVENPRISIDNWMKI